MAVSIIVVCVIAVGVRMLDRYLRPPFDFGEPPTSQQELRDLVARYYRWKAEGIRPEHRWPRWVSWVSLGVMYLALLVLILVRYA